MAGHGELDREELHDWKEGHGFIPLEPLHGQHLEKWDAQPKAVNRRHSN